eukprot:maker-scaffold1072_size64607-snap-gene-0.14 protein:Tk04380 transcript:maker-scaffold1072_size64607-snap-gene-0.14-mRNA-1 annotation:"PREDICTED: uncharacterized protein LOC755078"
MGQCSAPECGNRYGDGLKIFRFPIDPIRRQKWTKEMNRPKWIPNDNARLCEGHFTRDQFFLHGGTGRKVLRHDAIPTQFSLTPSDKVAKVTCIKPLTRSGSRTQSGTKVRIDQINVIAAAPIELETPENGLADSLKSSHFEAPPSVDFMPKDEPLDSDQESLPVSVTTSSLDSRQFFVDANDFEMEEDPLEEPFQPDSSSVPNDKLMDSSRIVQLEAQLKTMNTKHLRILKEVATLRKAARFLQNDELRLASKSKNLQSGQAGEWTPESLEKAQLIRSTCGATGYRTLQDLNYSLPSLRTLLLWRKGLSRDPPS